MHRRRTVLLAGLLLLFTCRAGGAATVTVPGDYATIQAAIDGAPDGSTIQLAPGVYHERIGISSVTRQLVLRGDPDAPESVVLDGDGVEQTIVILSTGSNVVVEGITITGGAGNSGDGGGLYMSDSHVVFRRVVFRDNVASRDGGAVFLLTSGGLFQECVFENNRAGRYGGGVMLMLGNTTVFEACRFVGNQSGTIDAPQGSGGGVHVNDSSPTFVECEFRGNASRGSGGGMIALGHYTEPTSQLTLRDCTFVGNTTQRVPGHHVAEGGALHVEDNVRAVLDGCRLEDNVANNGGGVSTYRGRVELVDSVVERNSANPEPDGGGYGGGIMAQSVNVIGENRPPASVTLQSSVVRDNVASIAGALFAQGDFVGGGERASILIEDSLLLDNAAVLQGGALKWDRAVATVRRTQVIGNRVTGTENFAYGGGLVSAASETTLRKVTFARNEAPQLGGGIYADQGGVLQIDESQFWRNQASTAPDLGGGAIAIGQALGYVPGPVAGWVRDSVIAANGGNELWESNCDLAQWSAVVYERNAIASPTDQVYYRNCAGVSDSVAAFNGLGSKASSNTDAAPEFAVFMAAPRSIVVGSASTLAWTVAGHGSLAVEPGGTLGDTIGAIDVGPVETQTYALAAGGTALGEATVRVRCGSLGTAVPREPSNGSERAPGDVTLRWFPARGAVDYDVFLDETADPQTALASGLVDAVVVAPALAPDRTYRWRVVANSPTCSAPVASPVYEFRTCGTERCGFADGFDDGDAGDWEVVGKGTLRVEDGWLVARARPRILALAPGPAMEDGTIEMSWRVDGGRSVQLVFAYQDATHYRTLTVKGRKRWVLSERNGGQQLKIAKGKRRLARGSTVRVSLVMRGGATWLAVDGTPFLEGGFPTGETGRIGVATTGGRLGVDDVLAVPELRP